MPTTRPVTRARFAAAALTVSSLLLAACSNSDGDASDDAPSESSPSATADSSGSAEASTVPTTEAPADASSGEASDDSEASTEAPTSEESSTAESTEPAEPDLGDFRAISGVPGVTDDQITVAVVGTGSNNPLGYCLLQCWSEGVQAYFDRRNELGGVHGRELVVGDVVDDALANIQVRLLELIERDDLFAIFASPVLYAGFEDTAKAGIPLYTTVPASDGAAGFDSIFQTTGTTCLNCLNPQYVTAAQLVGATKVASVGYGVAQASKDCVAAQAATIERWGPDLGIEVVYTNDTLPFGLPNGVAPEVTAMKDVGVDFVMTCIDQGGALAFEQEMERQGIGDVPIILPQGYSDDQFVSDNAELLEGDILNPFFHPYEATPIPAIETFLDATASLSVNDYTMEGWIAADQFVTGLLAAGPQFDRASVISATNQITGYTADGLIPPVDWTTAHTPPTPADPTTNEQPLRCSAFVRIQDGDFVLEGDPDKPFFCIETPMTDWVEPTPMSFG